MNNKQLDPNQDFELPPISDIDLSDDFDTPKPEPIVTVKKIEEQIPKKSHKGLYIVIAAILSVMLICGTLIWLFMLNGIYIFQGLPLRNYSNDIYSIKIPEGYTSNENNLGSAGNDATFVDPYENDSSVQSKVYIVTGQISDTAKSKYLSDLDSLYSTNNIEKSKKDIGFNGMANIEYSKTDVNGMQARTVIYDATKDKDRIGKYYKVSIFENGMIYEIIISAPNGNPGLAVDAQKIIDSFTIK